MRVDFSTLLVDMKRVKTFLSLPEWERFVEKDDDGKWNYPLVVAVALKDEKYTITSYCWFSHVRADLRDGLLAAARSLRSGNLAESGRDAPNYFGIKRVRGLAKQAAVKEAIAQMRAIREGMKAVDTAGTLGS